MRFSVLSTSLAMALRELAAPRRRPVRSFHRAGEAAAHRLERLLETSRIALHPLCARLRIRASRGAAKRRWRSATRHRGSRGTHRGGRNPRRGGRRHRRGVGGRCRRGCARRGGLEQIRESQRRVVVLRSAGGSIGGLPGPSLLHLALRIWSADIPRRGRRRSGRRLRFRPAADFAGGREGSADGRPGCAASERAAGACDGRGAGWDG